MVYSLDLVKASGVPTKTRPQWGSRHPISSYTIAYPGRYLFMHISVTSPTGTLDQRMRVIEDIGVSRFPNTRFSYNAVLHVGGAIYEGQPRGRKGAHTVNAKNVSGFPYDLNAYGDALCFAGMEATAFGPVEIESAARWFAAKVLSGESKATVIYPHNKFAAKACPGAKIMAVLPSINARFKQIVAAGHLPGGSTPPTGGDDLPYTPDQLAQYGANGDVIAAEKSTQFRTAMQDLIWADRKVYRVVNGVRVEIPAIQELADAKTYAMSAVTGIAALTATVNALASGGDASPEALEAIKVAAASGATAALTDVQVRLDAQLAKIDALTGLVEELGERAGLDSQELADELARRLAD